MEQGIHRIEARPDERLEVNTLITCGNDYNLDSGLETENFPMTIPVGPISESDFAF